MAPPGALRLEELANASKNGSNDAVEMLRQKCIIAHEEVSWMVANGQRANRMQLLQGKGQKSPFVVGTACGRACKTD